MPYVSLDITDSSAVKNIIGQISPDVVVHCAAWTAVDAAEDEGNKEKVFAINVKGTENIAKAAKELDCKMVYISTDYVFSGKGSEPWTADCKEYAPLSVYGTSKLQGEQAVSEILNKFFIVPAIASNQIVNVFKNWCRNLHETKTAVGFKYFSPYLCS